MTGGTGFIGSHTVEALLKEGLTVRCLVRPGRKDLGWLKGLPVETVEADLFRQSSLVQLLDNAAYVVHIAGVTRGKRRSDFFRGNAETTSNLLQAAERAGSVRQFCYLSSLTAVGPSADGTPVTEESECRPITPYGESKLAAERFCHEFSDKLPIVILRPPAVYGPRDRDILHMFRWIKFGVMPVMGPKEKTLSLIFALELARAIVRALTSPLAAGKTYFVSDPSIYKYSDLVAFSASLLKKERIFSIRLPQPLIYAIAGATQALSWLLPNPSVVNIDKVRDLVSPHWVCNAGKIGEELGFQPKIQAEEGLRKTLAWYRAEAWL